LGEGACLEVLVLGLEEGCLGAEGGEFFEEGDLVYCWGVAGEGVEGDVGGGVEDEVFFVAVELSVVIFC
jgi:hypothetical protein